MGAPVACGGDLEGPQALVLASTSPQRRAILEQLGLPFEVVEPRYEERGEDPVEHAAGKVRSVDGGGRPVVGVDTIVVCGGLRVREPRCAGGGAAMLGAPFWPA